MNRKLRKYVSIALIIPMLLCNKGTVLADSSSIVTLGADLNEEQKEKIYEFFGVDDSIYTIEVNNKNEREYLEGKVSDSIIGTKTFSCSYVSPTNKGEINVKTANLTWVTQGMIANALVTCGVDSCDVVATAPFEVSGTGALTGILMAYESATEEELDSDKKDLASTELVVTAELSDSIGEEKTESLLAEAKAEVVTEDNMSKEDIEKVVTDVAENNNVELDEEKQSAIAEMLYKMSQMEYDKEEFVNQLKQVNSNIESLSDTLDKKLDESKGLLEKIADGINNIFKCIANFFSSLFGGNKEDKKNEESSKSIFDNLDTNIMELDENKTEESNNDTTEVTSGSSIKMEEPKKEVRPNSDIMKKGNVY